MRAAASNAARPGLGHHRAAAGRRSRRRTWPRRLVRRSHNVACASSALAVSPLAADPQKALAREHRRANASSIAQPVRGSLAAGIPVRCASRPLRIRLTLDGYVEPNGSPAHSCGEGRAGLPLRVRSRCDQSRITQPNGVTARRAARRTRSTIAASLLSTVIRRTNPRRRRGRNRGSVPPQRRMPARNRHPRRCAEAASPLLPLVPPRGRSGRPGRSSPRHHNASPLGRVNRSRGGAIVHRAVRAMFTRRHEPVPTP